MTEPSANARQVKGPVEHETLTARQRSVEMQSLLNEIWRLREENRKLKSDLSNLTQLVQNQFIDRAPTAETTPLPLPEL